MASPPKGRVPNCWPAVCEQELHGKFLLTFVRSLLEWVHVPHTSLPRLEKAASFSEGALAQPKENGLQSEKQGNTNSKPIEAIGATTKGKPKTACVQEGSHPDARGKN